MPESELPLMLPETDNFRPSGSPESPLAAVSDWVSFTDPSTGPFLLPCLHPSLDDLTVALFFLPDSPAVLRLLKCSFTRKAYAASACRLKGTIVHLTN